MYNENPPQNNRENDYDSDAFALKCFLLFTTVAVSLTTMSIGGASMYAIGQHCQYDKDDVQPNDHCNSLFALAASVTCFTPLLCIIFSKIIVDRCHGNRDIDIDNVLNGLETPPIVENNTSINTPNTNTLLLGLGDNHDSTDS